jgi:F0F1-type ATP synthase membrane subunit b/b'
VVAVREKPIIASIVAFALLAGPTALSSAGAVVETHEPECYPADDGTDAYICEFPDDCSERSDCEAPPECELVDDNVVRCQPPEDDANTSDAETGTVIEASATTTIEGHELIEAPDAETAVGEPAVECGYDRANETLVCVPHEDCRDRTHDPSCRPSPGCERADEGHYRCPMSPGQGVPGQASSTQHRCQPDANGTLICESSENASTSVDTRGDPSPRCEPVEPGVVVCKPPTECEGKVGETADCTPPDECQAKAEGTFRCEVPERGHAQADTDEDSPFEADETARQQARAEVAASLQDAARGFEQRLSAMRADYRAQVDELRAEYEDGKDQLRADYRECRDAIPDDVDASETNARLRSCLEEARQGLASLKADLEDRHAQLKADAEQRIEQARDQACQEAERTALNAIAQHGVFEVNPGDLVPARALDMCPGFGDFQRGGEAR